MAVELLVQESALSFVERIPVNLPPVEFEPGEAQQLMDEINGYSPHQTAELAVSRPEITFNPWSIHYDISGADALVEPSYRRVSAQPFAGLKLNKAAAIATAIAALINSVD